MMESSTIMPSTTIRAARVTVFTSMPTKNIIARAMAVHTGTPELAMRADLMGNIITITSMTTSIDISRSLTKENTEVATTRGWSLTLLRVTLSGRVEEYSPRTLSTSLPKATMLLSGRISTLIIRQERPLYETYWPGCFILLST